MLFSELADEYLKLGKLERNWRPRTVQTNRYRYGMFAKYGDREVSTYTKADIRAFLLDCQERELNEETISIYVTTLRLIFNYAHEEGYIAQSPLLRLTFRSSGKKLLPRVIPLDHLAKLISSPVSSDLAPSPSAQKQSARDTLLVRLLTFTGLRIEEALSLRTDNLDLGSGLLHVVEGKGGNERYIPLLPALTEEICQFLLHWQKKPGDYVFVSRNGNKLVQHQAQNAIARHCRNLNLPHYTPHQFRHSFASFLRNQGVELDDIQDLLGHASLDTTRIYAKLDPRRMRKAVAEHPLTRLLGNRPLFVDT